MSADDDETSDESEASKPLSPRAEAALARARAAVRAASPPPKKDGGRWLALIPVVVAVLMMALMMPRATVPDAVPVPEVDTRALRATTKADDERAERAKATRLPTDVLAVGSGVRALQAAQQKEGEGAAGDLDVARAKLDEARRALVGRAGWEDDLLALRAVQMSAFLEELARYEATGDVSKDLEELGGGFIRRMDTSGWSEGRRILLDEPQRRVAFKTVWNAIVGVEPLEPFKLTLDEQRSLYALYLTRPHAGEAQQRSLDAMRRAATTPEGCARAAAEDRRAREIWRADKIRKLGAIDPTYPTAYALGVAHYRAGRYDLATDAFRSWLDAHPDGPWSARARNHLKAALAAYGSI